MDAMSPMTQNKPEQQKWGIFVNMIINNKTC